MTHGASREDHPLPAVVIHWVHLVCMVLLVLTGFLIDTPVRFLGMTMSTAQWVHYVCMYLVLLALAARVYWAFYGPGSTLDRGAGTVGPDYLNFAPQAANRGQLLETVKYYLFLRSTHPRTAKYNSLQKATYVLWGVLLLVQAYTGFAIYGPTYAWPVFAVGTALAGGLLAMRTLHYLIMWVFIMTSLIHIYLSVAEDIDSLPLMLWWRETRPAAENE
jgi:Ni/Fe-hydrogenase 1 B-type cytochrome subunit